MSRALLGRATLAGLPLVLLLACGGGKDVNSVPPPNAGDTGSTQSSTFAIFDPTPGASQFIPLPNVLVTGAANDPLTNPTGASPAVPRPANSPMTPPEALAYVNVYEMGRTNAVAGLNAPIYIRFSSPIDPASIAGHIKVFMVTGDTATGGLTEETPLTFPAGQDLTALFSVRYTAGSTDLFLFPNFPLTPGTKFVYYVSSGVKDASSGKAVTSSLVFGSLKSTVPLTGSLAALEPARVDTLANPAAAHDSTTNPYVFRGFAHTMDDLIAASATTGIASRNDIAVLGRFITTGAGFIKPDPVGSPSTRYPVETTLRQFAAGATLGGLSGKTWSNSVSGFGASTLFVKGGTPSPDNYWQAVTGSGAATAPSTVGLVALGTFASGDLNVDPVVAKANAATMDLTGTTGAYNPAAGVTQAFRNGGGQLTGYYHTDRTINFVYIAPDPGTVTRPTNGYPLVIYQHGITSQKETVIALATALTAKGYALIAIDLPLHGQNQFPGHTTGASWGNDFMAVGAPLATRTNLQQAVVNLSRLEFVVKTGGLSTALAGNSLATSTPDITTSPSNIKFMGVSLGAITGAYYLASNTTLSPSGAPYSQTSLNSDMKGFLNCPGGRTAYLINASPAFGPQVDAGLALAGIVKNTPTYHSFFQLTQSVVDPADPATLTTPLAAGLPSRLSNRVAMQEATSSTFDASGNPTNGDLVITNPYNRYFANALGGREVLGAAGAAVGPNFKQLAYTASGAFPGAAHAAGVVGTPFMFTLSPGPVPKVANAATQATDSTPTEGYFQFDQASIGHAFIINPANPLAIALGQRQFVYWLATGLVVDPTQQSGTLPIAATPLPNSMIFQAPETITIHGH